MVVIHYAILKVLELLLEFRCYVLIFKTLALKQDLTHTKNSLNIC